MGSGATVVIGGLIRDDTVNDASRRSRSWGISRWWGPCSGRRADHTQKTNLLLFITPHVMSTQEDLPEMTDQKKEEMPPD